MLAPLVPPASRRPESCRRDAGGTTQFAVVLHLHPPSFPLIFQPIVMPKPVSAGSAPARVGAFSFFNFFLGYVSYSTFKQIKDGFLSLWLNVSARSIAASPRRIWTPKSKPR